ncbi:FmdB family zinc ribbon protein [Terriglobus aquaticus]|uniref:Zinc ribbon domain-containing protein n=1 Tax=Terriglobus aquaticus TaxID=940139 RepID=A0ABW9KPF1_9BACT|nr:zinc ribbon domain-containing protein [Terriglobus aquaticus]
MPLYEYQCTACHRLTEKRQKFSDPELTECPFCGGRLERTITAPAVQFKGGGWYADLYSSGKKPAPAGASGEAGTGSSEATKSDGGAKPDESSKPASTPASTSSTPAATTPSTK